MPNSQLLERIKRIQARLELPADGIVGPVTLSRIEMLLDQRDQTEPADYHLMVSSRGLQRLLAFEVVSKSHYEKQLVNPVWPGGERGVTIGIGYDLGYHSAAQIRLDWQGELPEAFVSKLVKAAQVTGEPAKKLASRLNKVTVSFATACKVFYQANLPRYAFLTRKIFSGVERLPADAQAMLLSLVYNRGATLSGDSRREMRAIQELTPSADLAGIADQIEAMKRLCDPGQAPELISRREQEAAAIRNARMLYPVNELVLL